MALFQPTNVIPSTLTNSGTVSVADIMQVQWQVNGNSAMTAFQIDFYLNNATSDSVATTGKITKDNLPPSSSPLPFYGTDRFGNPQFFTYNVGRSWEEVDNFTDGNNYKLKITQFYNEGGVEKTVVQTSQSAFITRSKPTLNLFTTDDNYTEDSKVALSNGGSISTSIGYFHADYNQAQGDSVRWVRWQIASANNGVVGDILSDTGDIYTPTLNYEYNGFFNGQQYAIRCQVETESGVLADTDWVFFNIEYTESTYTGNFTVQCLPKENAALLEWEGVEVILPTVTGDYVQNSGSVTLSPNAQISWSKKKEDKIVPFDSPWTAVWKGKIGNYGLQTDSNTFSGTPTTPTKTDIKKITLTGTTITTARTKNITVSETGQIWYPDPTEPDYAARASIDGELNAWETGVSIRIIKRGTGVSNGVATFLDNVNKKWRVVLYGAKSMIGQEMSAEIEIVYNTYATTITQPLPEYYLSYSNPTPSENVTDYSISTDSSNFIVELTGNADNQTLSITVDATYTSEFSTVLSKTFIGEVKGYSNIQLGSNITRYDTPQISGKTILITVYCGRQEAVSLTADITYVVIEYSPQGKLFELDTMSNIISISRENNPFIIKIGNNTIATLQVPLNATESAVVISPNVVYAYFYADGTFISSTQQAISYVQPPINTVSILGTDNGATVDSVSVFQGDGSNVLSLYQNPDFEPVWNTEEYRLYMTANFNGNIQGGTGNAEGDGFQIYRQEIGSTVLRPIANVGALITSLKDYGLSSQRAYRYSLCVYDSNKAFMGRVESDNVVSTCFKNYSLLVCDYDEDNDEYHVRKQYLFALNLSEVGISNNNSPTLNKNFTPYPTRMGDTANYTSGTLSGLIGAIYTVPALIEQIGIYKHTTKPSTMDYFDNVDLEKELFDLSVSPYQLFLKDMKGHLRMIATSNPITMTTNIKQRQQSITMSLPWVDIGDASDVTIIQTPDDYGWNYDNQVLDVTLNVDVNTGELSATYPFPYNGTKFYLTGENKENLMAKTPIEVTPAQFNLSEVAEKTTDGEITATVTVNSETNTNKS